MSRLRERKQEHLKPRENGETARKCWKEGIGSKEEIDKLRRARCPKSSTRDHTSKSCQLVLGHCWPAWVSSQRQEQTSPSWAWPHRTDTEGTTELWPGDGYTMDRHSKRTAVAVETAAQVYCGNLNLRLAPSSQKASPQPLPVTVTVCDDMETWDLSPVCHNGANRLLNTGKNAAPMYLEENTPQQM